MSDVGKYDQDETEIKAIIEAIPFSFVLDVYPSYSMDDMLIREVIRGAAVGIVEGKATALDVPNIGNGKRVPVLSTWEIAVAVKHEGGAIAGRKIRREILEKVRDALNGQQSTNSLKARFRWKEEEPVLIHDTDICGTVATYVIGTQFGN